MLPGKIKFILNPTLEICFMFGEAVGLVHLPALKKKKSLHLKLYSIGPGLAPMSPTAPGYRNQRKSPAVQLLNSYCNR